MARGHHIYAAAALVLTPITFALSRFIPPMIFLVTVGQHRLHGQAYGESGQYYRQGVGHKCLAEAIALF